MKRIYSCLLLSLCLYPLNLLALETGAEAPDFTLPAYDGSSVHLADLKGKIVVLEWFNPGCPFVRKHYDSGHMQALQSKYAEKGVKWLVINSTNPKHRDFLSGEAALKKKSEMKIEQAVMLSDADGKVGKLYSAKTTPHMYVIDPEGNLVYQGAIDDSPSPFGSPSEATNYVAHALDELLAGQKVKIPQTDAYGCSIKFGD